MNLNHVQLIGRVGKDPEIKQLPSGRLVCSFSIATTRTWTQEGEKKEQTEWHNIVFFGDKLIENVIEKYVFKGSQVYIAGRIQTRSWEKDGEKKYRTEIIGEVIQLGARPKDGDGGRGERTERATPSRRTPKTAEEQEAMEAAQEGVDAFDNDADAPPPARRGAPKRTVKSTDGDEINPDDIPF